MEGDWVVLRHALFLAIQEKEWKVLGRGMPCLGKVAWGKTSEESFFPAKVEQERAFNGRSAFRMCEDRQDEVKNV